MSKTMLALGALAWLGVGAMVALVATAQPTSAAELRLPLLVGLLAVLLLALSLGWIGIYLVRTGRVLRDLAERPELTAAEAEEAGSQPSLQWPGLALGGVGLLIALFALTIERAGGRIGLPLFAVLAAGGLALVATLLARAGVLLARRERLLAAVDRAIGP